MPRPISSNASPEAQRAVVDGHFRGDLQPALLNVDLSIKSSLSSARCRARRPESRSAPSCLPEPRPSAPAYIPRLPCGPEGRGHRPIRTLWPANRSPLYRRSLALPRGRQSGDHRRRQVGECLPSNAASAYRSDAGLDRPPGHDHAGRHGRARLKSFSVARNVSPSISIPCARSCCARHAGYPSVERGSSG